MAIITLAAPVSGIRGKVGGLVYSANKSGPYLKSWARGSNPRTRKQTSHRANLVSFSLTWNTLSDADKLTWDVYAALPAQDLTNSLGEDYSISGFNWFIRINLNRFSIGDAVRLIAPTTTQPASQTIEDVFLFETGSASTTNIELPAGGGTGNPRFVIKAELVTSSGNIAGPAVRSFMLSNRFGEGVTTLPFMDELLEHFGTALEGQKVFVTLQVQSEQGRRSAPVAASAVTSVGGSFDTGWVLVGTCVNGSTPNWSTLTGPTIAGDGTFASVNIIQDESSGRLEGKMDGNAFSIPGGATIDGIETRQRLYATGDCDTGPTYLMKAGAFQIGTEKNALTSLSTTFQDIVLGGAADLWSTTWSVSEINNVGFGVTVNIDELDFDNEVGRCSELWIKVYYTT